MLFNARRKDKRWPGLKEATKKMQKAPPQQFDEYFKIMEDCVPDFTDYILKECLTKYIEVLSNTSFPESTVEIVIRTLDKMFEKSDPNKSDTNVAPFVSNNIFIIPSAFNRITPVNHAIARILTQLLLIAPKGMQDFLLKHQESVKPIIDIITETHDIEYTNLLIRFLGTAPEVSDFYMPMIREALPKWTATTVLSIWIKEPSTRDVIPISELDEWLMSFNSFEIDDVQQITKLYAFLWAKESIILMMIRTNPADKESEINFIKQGPIIETEIKKEIVEECCQSLDRTFKTDDNRISYTFIRYYVLSLSNPAFVDEKTLEMIKKSLNDSSDTIVAAAAQIFWNWQIKFGFKIDTSIFYLMASSIVRRPEDNECRILLQGIINCLGNDDELFQRIIVADDSLKAVLDKSIVVKRASFLFPHIKPHFNSMKKIESDKLKIISMNAAQSSLETLAEALDL